MHDPSETRVSPRDVINYVPVGAAQAQTETRADSPSTACGFVFHPIVKIITAKPAKRLGTGWHWWFSESIHLPIGNRIEFRFQGSAHLLVLYNEGTWRSGETSIDDLRSSGVRSFVHKLTFVPAGRTYREWHETGASTRVTFLYLNPAAFQKSDEGRDSLLPRIYFEDSPVWETASKLKNAVESGQTKCIPYLEALSGVLAHELARVNQTVSHRVELSRGGLASWQKRAVIGHIEKHLREQVYLAKLAELSGLSVHHFCRAFKQSFGIPPHRYQMQRRMEVAKLLLADRTRSVTDIAISLGYAQIGSFSSAFRKMTGWSPTVYRREFKGPDTVVHSSTTSTPSSAG